MIALTYRYKHTVSIRKSRPGGIDGDYSHSEIQEGTTTVVVPDISPAWEIAARNYVRHEAGHNYDPAFQFLAEPDKLGVRAILRAETNINT